MSTIKKQLLAFVLMMMASVSSAWATLPNAITDSTSGAWAVIQQDFTEMINDYMWPLLAICVSAWLLVDVFKKASKKSVK